MKRILCIWFPNRAALVELAAWCERYSPVVGIDESGGGACLLLDVTGLARLHGGEDVLIHRVGDELEARRLLPHIALADTVGAAWAAAHFFPSPRGRLRLRIPSSKTFATISKLPLEALRLPEKTIDVLTRLGIERIEQLADLPRDGVTARFGPQLIERLDQATGMRGEVIEAIHPPPEFAASWSLEHPTDRPEAIDFVIQQLIERVSTELAGRGRGALRLVCQLTGERIEGRRPSATLEVGLFQPSASPEHLWELIEMQREATAIPGLVADVSVKVTATDRMAPRQRELFDDVGHEADARELAILIDRLAGRLGAQAVVGARLRADAGPEHAWREDVLVAGKHGSKKGSDTFCAKHPSGRSGKRYLTPFSTRKRQTTFAPGERPLHLLAAPMEIEVTGEPPREFCWENRHHKVARHWGPERIETGWWRRRGIARDYYRIETTAGARFWLFRQFGDGRWFLHGVF